MSKAPERSEVSGTIYRLLESSPSDTEAFAKTMGDVYVAPADQIRRFLEKPHRCVRAGAFRDGEMTSCLQIDYYRIHYGTQALSMGGIGEVATHAEFRRQHHVANLLRLALEHMRTQGMTVSMLYPFSHAFYRKYGWEHASDTLRITLPIKDLASARTTGLSDSTHGTGPSRFVRVPIPAEGAADFGPLASVYEQAVHRYAGSAVRDDLLWQERVYDIREAASHGRNIYIYLGLRSETPVSYLIYTFESNPGRGRTLKVNEAFAVDAASFADVLGFLSTHDAQAEDLQWNMPVDSPIRHILAEPAKAELRPSFMFRVVDVKAFLETLTPDTMALQRAVVVTQRVASEPTAPAVDGDRLFPFSMQVSDPTCPWNDGVFVVDLDMESGGLKVSPKASSTDSDLEGGIAAFSQIASGYMAAEEANRCGRIRANRDSALTALGLVFPKRETYCADHF